LARDPELDPKRIALIGVGEMEELMGLLQSVGQTFETATPASTSRAVRQQVLSESVRGRVVQWMLPPGASAEMAQLQRPRIVMPGTDGVLALTGPDGQVLQDLYARVPFMWHSGVRGSIRNVSAHPVLLDVAEPN
jgi:hypothetical protein